jgi:hypothetical protein
MLQSVHVDIMRRALGRLFAPRPLELIIAANVGLDAIWNQIGHDELHFDNNALERSYAYISAQRALIGPALHAGQARKAWEAFGRLTHTAQDFYSHTNYVGLWLDSRPVGVMPVAADIDPLDQDLIESPSLRSGKAYLPVGALSFVPGVGDLVDRLLPADSHARMHLDSGHRGPAFEFAFEAAIKRTRHEYFLATRELPEVLVRQFQGISAHPVSHLGT